MNWQATLHWFWCSFPLIKYMRQFVWQSFLNYVRGIEAGVKAGDWQEVLSNGKCAYDNMEKFKKMVVQAWRLGVVKSSFLGCSYFL